ncbi:UDP-N-acetylmuramate dehydrogenase [Rhizobium sp. L1K21]|uniref:UDP-N-acetylmuramate dehydrogenase n=1 Tax=Rhizobium sp. L1K21 TaxID=2954933 RepID=UPI00209363E9|nr:UDP-N-acetylmuramate dehydrogenase [Rhizobium sp. L1K21]MCO6187663.1 UDP-N-acetylmuramate dehydrogenase [Rhizobium sp. L1K21]
MHLIEHFDLRHHNTLGLPARARFGGLIHTLEDLAAGLAAAQSKGLPFHLLGGGSNCVLGQEIEAVIGVMAMRGRSIESSDPDSVKITAKAGESWPDLVEWTVAQGIGGLENLSGIPGTVGAAPVQNIGAYGREISQFVERVIAHDTRDHCMRTFRGNECAFRYRNSRFKDEPGRYLITEVVLALPRAWQAHLSYAGLGELGVGCTPQQVSAAVLQLRASKLPDWRKTGNAGSFFHNPVVPQERRTSLEGVPFHIVDDGLKLSAGWLLEACGLKGYRLGGAGFSEKHALVLVNHGGADFSDVKALADEARRRVAERFGVHLVQEPVTLT